MIVSAEPVPKMDKLSAIEVDVGDEEPVKIITNAPNAKEGNRIVVALIGAIVRPSSAPALVRCLMPIQIKWPLFAATIPQSLLVFG